MLGVKTHELGSVASLSFLISGPLPYLLYARPHGKVYRYWIHRHTHRDRKEQKGLSYLTGKETDASGDKVTF